MRVFRGPYERRTARLELELWDPVVFDTIQLVLASIGVTIAAESMLGVVWKLQPSGAAMVAYLWYFPGALGALPVLGFSHCIIAEGYNSPKALLNLPVAPCVLLLSFHIPLGRGRYPFCGGLVIGLQ